MHYANVCMNDYLFMRLWNEMLLTNSQIACYWIIKRNGTDRNFSNIELLKKPIKVDVAFLSNITIPIISAIKCNLMYNLISRFWRHATSALFLSSLILLRDNPRVLPFSHFISLIYKKKFNHRNKTWIEFSYCLIELIY